MNDRHDFSKEYEDKKKALLRSLEKADRVEKCQHRMPVMRAITAVLLAVVMLSGGVFAATKLGLFNIRREDDRILVEVATGETVVREESEYIDMRSSNAFKIYADYMPPVTGCEPGIIPDWWFGDDQLRVDLAYCTEGEKFDVQLPASAITEEFELNGHRAMFVFLGETQSINKIVFTELEQEDLLLCCYAKYSVSEEEIKNFVAGLRVERMTDEEIETMKEDSEKYLKYAHRYSWKGDLMKLSDDYVEPIIEERVYSKIHNLDVMTPIEIGESFEYPEPEYKTDATVTLLDVSVYDSASDFEYEKFYCDLNEGIDENGNWINSISLFMDEEGNFIEYPRNTIIKAESETEQDRFSETEMVKKKLVRVTYSVKNNLDKPSSCYVHHCLRMGTKWDSYKAYVYDRTPMFYTNLEHVYSTYEEHRDEKLAPGEERTISVFYLIDEDLLDTAYHVFMHMDRYVKLSD